MVFGSPASIGLSSQQSVHVAANQHVNLVSGQSVNVAVVAPATQDTRTPLG